MYTPILFQAADAQEANNIEVARKHHKNAQFCNIGGIAVLLLAVGLVVVITTPLLIIEGFSCLQHCIV